TDRGAPAPSTPLSAPAGRATHIALTPGTYHTFITAADNLKGDSFEYDFQLTATAVDDMGAEGRSGTINGTITTTFVQNNSLPVGHTIVKGVDLYDGHVTVSSTDVAIHGRGLSLEFTRTYSSQGYSTDGPLGAGWTYSYNIQLARLDNGDLVVIGGEGSGNRFDGHGKTNPALAQLFG